MKQTITEKIFSDHVGKEVSAGEIIESKIDMIIGNDITTPISIKQFERSGAKKLANPDGFAIVMDHYIPTKDILSANQAKISREFAYKHDLKNYFDEKDMGIEHALLPEKGLVVPGDVIIGADSHTCTHGALGAFSTGMGSTDLAYAMITGKNWFKVPESIKVVFKGKLDKHVYGKDLILEIIRQIGVDGALYKALEFSGEVIEGLSMDDRFSMCNMAIEAGGKSGIIAVDEITKEFLKDKNLGGNFMKKLFSLAVCIVMMFSLNIAGAKIMKRRTAKISKKAAKKSLTKIKSKNSKLPKVKKIENSDIPEQRMIGIPNPASIYCEKNGGKSIIKLDGDGNEYGVCKFKDGKEIDEWDFYRKNNKLIKKGTPEDN